MRFDERHVADRLEIQDLLMRYALAVDNRDWDLYRSVFAPDAFIDYTSAGGVKGSVDEVATWLEKVMAQFAMSQHPVFNAQLSIDGDTATGRSYFFNPMSWVDAEGARRVLLIGGYYNDRFVRPQGEWKIAERIEETSWFFGDWPQFAEQPQA